MKEEIEKKRGRTEFLDNLPKNPDQKTEVGELLEGLENVDGRIDSGQKNFESETSDVMMKMEADSGLTPEEMGQLKQEGNINDELGQIGQESTEVAEQARERFRGIKKAIRNLMILCSAVSVFYGGEANISKAFGAEKEGVEITKDDVNAELARLNEGEKSLSPDDKINAFIEELEKLGAEKRAEKGNYQLWGDKNPEMAKLVHKIKDYLEGKLGIDQVTVNALYGEFNRIMNEEASESKKTEWEFGPEEFTKIRPDDGNPVSAEQEQGLKDIARPQIGLSFKKRF